MDAGILMQTPWFQELCKQVESELERVQAGRIDLRPAQEQELETLRSRIAGWTQSLGKSDLAPQLRSLVESEMSTALKRIQELEFELQRQSAVRERAKKALDPEQVLQRLQRLSEVLESNPTQANFELSMVIDRIECFASGEVRTRFCRLGLAPQLVNELKVSGPLSTSSHEPIADRVTHRKRTLLQVEDACSFDTRARLEFASHPDRFAGLPDSWIETFELRVPQKTCWSEANSPQVAAMRSAGLTHEQLAAHFGVSVPTIRKAIESAIRRGSSVEGLPRKMPRRRWHEEHALEVQDLKRQGRSILEIAKFMGKSDTTIRKALCYPHSAQDQLDPRSQSDNAA